jgi:peptidoglycan/LPS O-acetylase OafA/YrhL
MYLASLMGRVGLKAEVAAISLAIASIIVMPLFPAAFRAAIVFIPASAALVYVFARSEGPVSRLLSNRSLVLLGEASFALYMIHVPLGHYLGFSVPVAVLAVGLSILIHRGFELPAQKRLLRALRTG